MSTNLLLGRLRRDTMVLGTSENAEDLQRQGEDAVKQGRAAEVWIIPCSGYFSESDQNWGGIDRYQGGTRDVPPSSVPALNPGAGEQEPDGISDRPTVSIASNIAEKEQEQRDSGDLIDTGPADRLAEAARGSTTAPAAGNNEDVAKEAQKPSVNPDDKPASEVKPPPTTTK